MAKIIHDIRVEVAKPNLFQAIVGKQNDHNSRFLKATLVHENTVISAADAESVTINAQRPDGESKRFPRRNQRRRHRDGAALSLDARDRRDGLLRHFYCGK